MSAAPQTVAGRLTSRFLGDPRRRAYDEVLGINERNQLIEAVNPLTAIRLVDDKVATKQLLTEADVPVPDTIVHIERPVDARDLEADELPDAWACKPNRGLGGNGILIAVERTDATTWRTGSGRRVPLRDVRTHVQRTVDGEYSSHDADSAFFEPLILTHPDLAQLAHEGLPDIRVLCRDGEPALAMTRLPTSASDGKANLHQGAIGAAVDLDRGVITAARDPHGAVTHHPDTGVELLGARLPAWEEIVEMSRRCGPATGLTYVGADIVVDVDDGPLVLEVNARPGLEIQNVHGRGLRPFFADLLEA
jgi:alpha-L-glutamate ligase-like protein